jgi:hypothetical protein
VLGLLFLLGQFLRVDVMRFFWPVFIMAAGGAFFVGMVTGGRSLGALAIPGSVILTLGLLLFFQNLFGAWGSWAYAWTLIITGAGIGLVIFGRWSEIPDLVRAGRVVITVGVGLFLAFGLFFELGASLLGMRSPGGVLWALALILAGLYVVFGRRLLGRWTDSGPVQHARVDFTPAPPPPPPVVTPSTMEGGPQVSPVDAITTPAPDATVASGAVAYAATEPASGVAGEAAQQVTNPVAGIRRVRFRTLGDMTILQGEREGLEIEASQAVLERIRTDVHGDLLEIRFENEWTDWLQPRFWGGVNTPRYTLYLHDLTLLESSGLGNLSVPSMRGEHLDVLHTGAGNVVLRKLELGLFSARLSGLGNIEAEGRAERQELELHGAGNFEAAHLKSATASVRLSGMGAARVWVRDRLEARISGAGNIEYYGSPQVAQTVTGLGSVKHMGER